jgi:anti-sigma regulatory factor (Ser/Thr protein kinase)
VSQTQLNDSDEVVLRLPLSCDAELRAVDALDRLLKRHRVERLAAGQARFALVEACLNAIEYAEPGRRASSEAMDVRLAIRGNELSMSVRNPGGIFQPDAGLKFSSTASSSKTSSSKAGRGHGLKIIRAFMDRVRYLNDGGGTRVEMSKRVEAQS